MLRIVLVTALVLAGSIAFAQETNAGTNVAPAPAPVVVAEAKKYPDAIKFSGIARMHYDVSFVSNGGATNQKWGEFNFWFLTLKAQADIAENLKAEMSFDLGYFSGQRNSPGLVVATAKQLMVDKLIETAYLQYKVFSPLVISAGRFWEYYAPWVYSQQTRDGVSVSGSVFDGFLKYGVQLFNDSVLSSVYTPLWEMQIGVMPMKGINLDVSAYFAGNPSLATNQTKIGLSANLKIVKWSVLPDLVLMNEFVLNSLNSTYMGTFIGTNNTYNNFTTIGWQIGTIQPFVELYLSDRNLVDATVWNDMDFQVRLAAKWDVNPNFAVVPYIICDVLKSSVVPSEPLSIRLRADIKF